MTVLHHWLAVSAIACAVLPACTDGLPDPSPSASAGEDTLTANAAFVMAYFKENPSLSASSYALHLAVSSDGLEWTPLNQSNPVATPTQGTRGLRDPFLLRKQDGTFVVIATDLNGTDFSQQNQFIADDDVSS